MPVAYNSKYRVKRSKQYEESMRAVSKLKVFDGYPVLLMYSALLGYHNAVLDRFSRESEPVQLQFFENSDLNIMDFLCFMHEEGKHNELLRDEDGNEKYMIFANYANAGYPILLKKLGISLQETVFDNAREKDIANKLFEILVNEEFEDIS